MSEMIHGTIEKPKTNALSTSTKANKKASAGAVCDLRTCSSVRWMELRISRQEQFRL